METDEQKIYCVYNHIEKHYIKIYYHDISKWCCVVTPDLKDEFAGSSTASDNFDDLYSNSWVDEYLDHYKKYVIEKNSSIIEWSYNTSVISGFDLDHIPEDWICTHYFNNLAPSFMNKNKTREFYILDHMDSDIVQEFGDKKSLIEYTIIELKDGDWESEIDTTDNFLEVIKEMEEN